jgi:hypothetical protein
MDISKGQRLPLSSLFAGVGVPHSIQIGLQISGMGGALDFACFGLDAQQKLSDDRYMTFSQSAENALRRRYRFFGSLSGSGAEITAFWKNSIRCPGALSTIADFFRWTTCTASVNKRFMIVCWASFRSGSKRPKSKISFDDAAVYGIASANR